MITVDEFKNMRKTFVESAYVELEPKIREYVDKHLVAFAKSDTRCLRIDVVALMGDKYSFEFHEKAFERVIQQYDKAGFPFKYINSASVYVLDHDTI